jgi:hypothetical protein
MKSKAIYLSIGTFVALVVGMSIFTILAKNNLSNKDLDVPGNKLVNEEIPYGIERIDAIHFYRDGVHTIVGSLLMPTPCDLLEVSHSVAESMPEQVRFEFTVLNTAGKCPQVATEQRFRVDVIASAAASMRATFMGNPVVLNLIEAESGATPDDFELFTKG